MRTTLLAAIVLAAVSAGCATSARPERLEFDPAMASIMPALAADLAPPGAGAAEMASDSVAADIAELFIDMLLWGTPGALGAGMGMAVPFDDDIGSGPAWAFQFGFGAGIGFGFRYMGANFDDKLTGEKLETDTWFFYLGIGDNFGQSDQLAWYLGGAVGRTWLNIGTETYEDSSRGLVAGLAYFNDFAGVTQWEWGVTGEGGGAVGIEVGIFDTHPGGYDLDGMSIMLTGFLYF